MQVFIQQCLFLYCFIQQILQLFSDQSMSLKATLLKILLIINLSWMSLGVERVAPEYYIQPLEAGSITILNKQLRQPSNIIEKTIKLKHLSEEYYNKHQDINGIVSITEISVDYKLNFYFTYAISCSTNEVSQQQKEIIGKQLNAKNQKSKGCFLNLQLTRNCQLQSLTDNYNYFLKLDYLVAHGLKILKINMTSFQYHISKPQFITASRTNILEDNSAAMPTNIDAEVILLFPNGWSEVNKTGYIRYNVVPTTNMFVLHYMNEKKESNMNNHEMEDGMGFDEKKDFVLLTIVMIKRDYLGKNSCLAGEYYHLLSNYKHNCTKSTSNQKHLSWFVGFKGWKFTQSLQAKFNYDHQDKIDNFQFEISDQMRQEIKTSQGQINYGLLYFPFYSIETTSNQQLNSKYFQDTREHDKLKKSIFQKMINPVLFVIIFLGAFILTRKYLTKNIYQCINKNIQKKNESNEKNRMHMRMRQEQLSPNDQDQAKQNAEKVQFQQI